MKILLTTHPQFRPDKAKAKHGTEKDIWTALKRLGHTVHVLGLSEDLSDLEFEIEEFKPSLVFNLLEELRGEAVFDFHMVSYLEAKGIPYTGCNPRGLILSRNKFLVSQLSGGLGVKSPRTWMAGGKVQAPFPLFVKLNREHASLGIRESNRVMTPAQLRSVCARLRRDFSSEVIVQEFIDGHDVSVGVWGNKKVEVFSPRILVMKMGSVSTRKLKFDLKYQRERSAQSHPYKGELSAELKRKSAHLFQALDMSGYARFDFRMNEEPYLIDINANPNLAKDEDFSLSAKANGWSYLELVEEVINLGLRYRPRV